MSHDSHGQAHTANIGLFDDQDEWEETQQRLQKRADRELARELKWREKQRRKAEGTTGPRAEAFRAVAQFFKFTTRKERPCGPENAVVEKQPSASSESSFDKDSGPSRDNGAESDSTCDTLVEETPYYIPAPIQSPETQPMYPESWIHLEPSILLEECGCVRVKSLKPGDGGWTVVPRSAILWGQ